MWVCISFLRLQAEEHMQQYIQYCSFLCNGKTLCEFLQSRLYKEILVSLLVLLSIITLAAAFGVLTCLY